MLEKSVFTNKKETINFIKEKYGINVTNIKIINRGSANIYSLNGDEYILKEFQSKYTKEEIEKEITIINHLKKDGIKVPSYIKTINDTYYSLYKDKVIIIQKFIEGYTLDRNEGNYEQTIECAKVYGMIVESLENLDILLPLNDLSFSKENLTKGIEKHQKLLELINDKDDEETLKIKRDLEEKINALVKNINGVKYKLGKIAQFKNGLNYDKSSAGEEVSIVGVADFKDNKSPIWDDVEKVVINGKLEDSFLLQKNDLLTVRSNGSQELVGRFMIVNKDLEEKTTFSGFTIRVRPDSEVVKSEFLYYILSSPIIRKQLVVGSNGSNIKSLNQTLLANVEISIPSMKKQEEILSELLAIENQIIEQRSIIEFGQEKKNRIIEDELI